MSQRRKVLKKTGMLEREAEQESHFRWGSCYQAVNIATIRLGVWAQRGGENQAGSSGGKGHTGGAEEGAPLLALPIIHPEPAEGLSKHTSLQGELPMNTTPCP